MIKYDANTREVKFYFDIPPMLIDECGIMLADIVLEFCHSFLRDEQQNDILEWIYGVAKQEIENKQKQ